LHWLLANKTRTGSPTMNAIEIHDAVIQSDRIQNFQN
jgi:hypothetical protein